MLRLTLRTLLAYLDDTLDPAQAKAIGQKVAESDSARELIERIKQVTRRRRLTTPPTTGPSKIDPNTIADYLDNAVTPEQAAEVEQICLSSDVHLAEVAACHQILTLILGEPVKPPVSANQRMYALVKGPEAIPFRKPARSKTKAEADVYAESGDIDETLRLGLPALGRKDGWRNPLVMIGGGFLAAILLVVAIYQVLSLPGPKEPENKVDLAQVDKSKGEKVEASKEKEGPAPGGPGDKKVEEPAPTKEVMKDNKGEEKDANAKVVPMAEPEPTTDVPFAPPNLRAATIGQYVVDNKDSHILLQSSPETKQEWRRFGPKKTDVYTARPLLTLPASRAVVQTNRGVRLTLLGYMPEFILFPPLFESVVELFSHDVLDLDMILHRGRIVLNSTRKDKPVHVRLRFENPMMGSDKELSARQEFFDFTLLEPGTKLLVDRWSVYPETERFFKDPKSLERIGPTAYVACVLLEGAVTIKSGDTTQRMSPAPGPAVMFWSSLTGPSGPAPPRKEVLEIAQENPPPPPTMDPKYRKDMIRARDYLAAQLTSVNVDVGLAQSLNAPDPATRRLVVRCLAAVSDLSSLLEALDQPKLGDLRVAAIEALRHWIATSRDNDYTLFGVLKERYKHKEAEIIMEMMHSFSEAERRRPERYELLIDYLVNPNLVIRELGYYHLTRLEPAGRGIAYSAAADSQARGRAEAAWRALIPAGQLPPSIRGLKK